MSPSARILIGLPSDFIIPAACSFSGVTSLPDSNLLSWLILTVVYSVRKMFVKPRFLGRRLIKGSCPPSKPGRTLLLPDRAFWPLQPRPENVPCPLPLPRPTRLLACLEPGAGE